MAWYVRTGFSFLVLLYETWMQVLEIQNFRMMLKGSALVTLNQKVEADSKILCYFCCIYTHLVACLAVSLRFSRAS